MQEKEAPRVSVITAVRNCERHLSDALESILGQTLTDFEFLIIDDASDDGTPDILAGFAERDARIRLIRNETNLGPYPSANKALELARAPLIARMDGDDVSEPDRLQKQVAFLDRHPDHILVSSSYRAIDDEGRTLYLKRKPADDFCVQWWMRFRMCLEHPATCFRVTYLDGTPVRYDESKPVAQDYELFSRLARHAKMAVLPDVLFNYRIHGTNITSTRRHEQAANVLRIARDNQARAFDAVTADALEPMMRSFMLGEAPKVADLPKILNAISRIIEADIAKAPERRTWIMRQAAEVLAHALLAKGGGLSDPSFVLAFSTQARRFLPALIMRVVENRNLLPGKLESYPDVR